MLRRSSQSRQQHLHLFIFCSRRKERSSCEYLKDEAAQTPYIDLVIIRLHEHNFRRAVVATLNVGEFLSIRETSRSKVYQLDS